MLTPGEYGEVLRTLGRVLDAAQAQDAQVLELDATLVLRWRTSQGRTAERNFRRRDLPELGDRVRQMHEGVVPRPGGERADVYHRLGQYLDDQGVRLLRLVEQEGSYGLTGLLDDQPITLTFSATEVHALRRPQPGHGQPAPAAHPPPPSPTGT